MSQQNQQLIDSCTASSDAALKKNASDGALDQTAARAKIRSAREALEEAIKKLDSDPEADKDKISKAISVSDESLQTIESDVGSLAEEDNNAAAEFSSISNQGDGNASNLGSLEPSAPSESPVAADAPASALDSSGTSPSSSMDLSPVPFPSLAVAEVNSGGQNISSPIFAGPPGFRASPAFGSLAEAAAPATTVGAPSVFARLAGSEGKAAPSLAAIAPLAVAVESGSGSSSAHAVVAGSAAEAPAGAANSAESSFREDLRRRISAAAARTAAAQSPGNPSSAETNAVGGFESAADQGAPGAAAGSRGVASLGASEGVEVSESEGHPGTIDPSGNAPSGSRFSLLSGGDTEAAVRKLVGDFSKAGFPQPASNEEIGERNGPSLFARSHATIERSWRRGQIRGVAVR